jgi:hypothetical protein
LYACSGLACDPKAIIHGPDNSAWWLRISFTPCEQNILGLAVDKIHPKWVRASVLKKEYIPASALFETGQDAMAQFSKTFQLNGDFNGDKRADRAIVGVYEEADGTRGLFVAIFTEAAQKTWSPVFLHAFAASKGILFLERSGSAIRVWECMECDGFGNLRWDRKLGKYAWGK